MIVLDIYLAVVMVFTVVGFFSSILLWAGEEVDRYMAIGIIGITIFHFMLGLFFPLFIIAGIYFMYLEEKI